jgi:hypothetical protein
MHSDSDPFLCAFTNEHGNWIKYKYYSFGMYQWGAGLAAKNATMGPSNPPLKKCMSMATGAGAWQRRTRPPGTTNTAWTIISTSPCCVCNCRGSHVLSGGNDVYDVACQGENEMMGAPNQLSTGELKLKGLIHLLSCPKDRVGRVASLFPLGRWVFNY